MQPDGVTRTDDEEVVGDRERGEGRRVATRRSRVVGELLVLLDAEAEVEDDERGEPPRQLEDLLDRRGTQLGPSLRADDAGDDPQPRGDLGGEARERDEV